MFPIASSRVWHGIVELTAEFACNFKQSLDNTRLPSGQQSLIIAIVISSRAWKHIAQFMVGTALNLNLILT